MFVTAIHARMKDHVSPMEIHFPVLASLVLVETFAKLVSLKCVSGELIYFLSLTLVLRFPEYSGRRRRIFTNAVC